MISTNQTLSSTSQMSEEYMDRRKDLLAILRLVNSRLDFNSQTFFLAVCYMDELFSKPLTATKLNDYVLLALSCLLIASKFTENDPNVPELRKYISAIADATKYRFTFTINDLRYGELIVLKYLDYRLNYYSIYHYITFFFAHGIILSDSGRIIPIEDKNESLGSTNNDSGSNKPSLSFTYSNKQLLEKVYILSRELLDYIIEDATSVVIGKENAIAAVEILKKAIEAIIRIDNTNEDVFEAIYKITEYINTNPNSESIKQMVNKVFEIKVLKKQEAVNMLIEPVKENIIAPDDTKKDTHYSNTRSGCQWNLNNTKPSFSNNYARQIGDLTNQRDYSNNLTVRKRACSSSKDHLLKGTEDLYPKNKFIYKNNYNNYNAPLLNSNNNNQELLSNHSNTNINPVYQKYNKRPPVKSMKIKKETTASKGNSQSTTSSATLNHMVNSQSHTIISPNSLKQQPDEDILDKTKKIIENANKAKNESLEQHYSINNNNALEDNVFNVPFNQSQIQNEFSVPGYNTIIINNNININTFIQKKGAYDEQTKCKMDIDEKAHGTNENHHNNKYAMMMNHNHFNLYHNSLLNNHKETDLIHRPNYFGTYFDYGSDLLTHKIANCYGKKMLNHSRINNKYGDDLIHFN